MMIQGKKSFLVILAFLVFFMNQLPVFGEEQIIYQWDQVFYGKIGNSQALLYNDSIFHGKLTFGDLDNDGDLDMLLGKKDGGISKFENQGSKKNPKWRLVKENITANIPIKKNKGIVDFIQQPIFLGSYSAPALVDIDNDGDLDLIVGNAKGSLFFFRNTGNEVLHNFKIITNSFIPRNFGRRIVPYFADIDGDMDMDLFLGNESGQVYLLPNIGHKKKPAFCAKFPPKNARPDEPPPCRPSPRVITSIRPESHAAPSLVDWDADGDLDLFIGKRNGTIAYFQNSGTRLIPRWGLTQSRFLSIDNGGFAGAGFIDVNGDLRPDLLAGNSTNKILLYTYKDTGKIMDVWKVTGNLLKVNRIGMGHGRIAIASGDLDNDGDIDLIIGDRDGNLRWVENQGTKKEPFWKNKESNLFQGSPRQNTTPFLVDLDNDGDLDLVVGGKDGQLWMIRNDGTKKNARWILADTRFGGIEVGANSVPVMVDIDKDGDLDLFVGNSRGLIIYFRNEGKRGKPRFKLTSTRFAGISAGQSAFPTFFDWNQDKKPDLIVGNRQGRLILTINTNPEKDNLLRSWSLKSRFLENIQVKGFSAPHFNDFNGDGKIDLMVGDGEGNTRLWLNGGFEKIEKKKRQVVSLPATGMAQPGISPFDLSEGVPSALPGALPIEELNDDSENLTFLLTDTQSSGPLPPEYTLVSKALGGLKFKGKAVPDFHDLDGDGDLDLLVGTGKGLLVYFQNVGSRKKPKWKKITENYAGFNHGRNAAPLFADIDGDKVPELLVGTEKGRVLLFQNVSKTDNLKFVLKKDAFSSINVGRNSAPAVVKLDKDKKFPVVVGNLAGNLVGYGLIKGKDPFALKRNYRKFLKIDVGLSATPYLGDMDRDGIPELMVGSDMGIILNYKKIPPSVKNPWGWLLDKEFLKTLKFPPGSTPRLVDIDDDGDMDLVVGTEKGTLYLYRNDADSQDIGAQK